MWYLMIHICLRRKSWGRLKLIIIKDLYCWNCCIHLFSKTSTGSSNFNILCRVCIQVQRYYNYIRLLPANNIELGKMDIISFPPLFGVTVQNRPLVLLLNCTAPTHDKIFLGSIYIHATRKDHQSRYSSAVLRRIHWVLRCLGGTHA